MSSTRNKNTKEDYYLQQQQFIKQTNYNVFENGFQGKAFTESLPSLGFNPSYMSRDAFSHNSIDIETKLFGISSNNFYESKLEIKPEFKSLKNQDYFDKTPLIMPKLFVQDISQRPFPI
jgi:hypothetical protein